MARPLSKDLRERVVAAVAGGSDFGRASMYTLPMPSLPFCPAPKTVSRMAVRMRPNAP